MKMTEAQACVTVLRIRFRLAGYILCNSRCTLSADYISLCGGRGGGGKKLTHWNNNSAHALTHMKQQYCSSSNCLVTLAVVVMYITISL